MFNKSFLWNKAGYDEYTKLMLHMDGTNGSTTFTDEIGNTITANGNAQISTAQKVFGTSSYLGDGTTDGLSTPNSSNWDLGTANNGDFTIEFRLRFNTSFATAGLFGTADSTTAKGYYFYYDASGNQLILWSGLGTSRVLSWTPSADTWYGIALERYGSTITCYIGGTSIGTFSDGDFSSDGNQLIIGALFETFALSLNGYIDEFRISKGIARHQGNYTLDTAPF